jgi:hypothetical protein
MSTALHSSSHGLKKSSGTSIVQVWVHAAGDWMMARIRLLTRTLALLPMQGVRVSR